MNGGNPLSAAQPWAAQGCQGEAKPATEPTSGAKRSDGEADKEPMEVAENDRHGGYRLHGASSRDTARDRGRFVPQRSTAERFWALVDRNGPGGCWLWLGHVNPDGYGQFKVTEQPGRHRTIRAHRWAYEATYGPIGDGLTLDHLCGTTRCVRPSHLEPVTNAENLRRRHARRRQNTRTTRP